MGRPDASKVIQPAGFASEVGQQAGFAAWLLERQMPSSHSSAHIQPFPPTLHPQCAPSEDEFKLLRSFLEAGGKPEALADAEKFAYELGQVGSSAVQLPCPHSKDMPSETWAGLCHVP